MTVIVSLRDNFDIVRAADTIIVNCQLSTVMGVSAVEFSLVGPDKLKITLAPDDLALLGVDYQSLDYKDEHTRKVLTDLLSKGRAAGFVPGKAKLYIEIYPHGEGGCVIYYSRLAGGKFLPGVVPIAFAFEDTGTLLRACALAHSLYRHRILRSSLYTLGQEYRLIVYPLDYNDKLSVSFLREFARPVGEGNVLAAYIEEHGKLIDEGAALDTMARIEGGEV